MAYTYKDFYDKATQKGMLGQFGEGELEQAEQNPEYGLAQLRLKQSQQTAKTLEQRLVAQQTQTKVNQGYAMPNQQMPQIPQYRQTDVTLPDLPALPDIQATAPDLGQYQDFEWEKENQYKALMDKIMHPQEFKYDESADPAAAAYRKAYAREGARAQENALARSSAMTGGVASSYAASATAQAGDAYAAKMADKTAELAGEAYKRSEMERGKDLQALQALSNERGFEYGKHQQEEQTRYQQALQAYQIDYQLQKDAYQQAMDKYNLQLQRALQMGQISQMDYEKAMNQYRLQYQQFLDAWKIRMQEEQTRYQQALQAYQLGSKSPEILEILGLDPTQDSGGSGGGWSWNRWYAEHGHKRSPGTGRPAVAPTNNYFDRYNDLVNGKIQ